MGNFLGFLSSGGNLTDRKKVEDKELAAYLAFAHYPNFMQPHALESIQQKEYPHYRSLKMMLLP